MLRAPEPARPSVQEVHLYFSEVDKNRAVIQQYWNILSCAEKDRALRLRREEDRERLVVSRGMLRMLLGHFLARDPKIIEFVTEINGKPKLAEAMGDSDICFNISHSGNALFLGFTHGLPIGVDVEKVREDLEVASLAQRFFSANECAELAALPTRERYSAFFRYWTRNEAVAKGLGLGLGYLSRRLGADAITSEAGGERVARPDLEEGWTILDVSGPSGYSAAAAVKAGGLALRPFHFSL